MYYKSYGLKSNTMCKIKIAFGVSPNCDMENMGIAAYTEVKTHETRIMEKRVADQFLCMNWRKRNLTKAGRTTRKAITQSLKHHQFHTCPLTRVAVSEGKG